MIFLIALILALLTFFVPVMTNKEPTAHGQIVIAQFFFVVAVIVFIGTLVVGYGGRFLGWW